MNGTDLSDGGDISGSTSSTLTLNNMQLSSSGAQLTCVVSNALGAVTSQMATVTVLATGPRVAILDADSILGRDLEVKTNLLATGIFQDANVDVFNMASIVLSNGSNVPLSISVPTLGQLAPYAAVLVWSYAGFGDSTALGNVLADYADLGGGVVVASSALHFVGSPNGPGLSGRIVSYLPLSHGPPALGVADMTLVPDLPQHPLLQRVWSLRSGPVPIFERVNVNAGATLIAHWTELRNALKSKPEMQCQEKNGQPVRN